MTGECAPAEVEVEETASVVVQDVAEIEQDEEAEQWDAELPLPACWFDTAKVMIWSRNLSLKPMSRAEVIYNK